MPKLTDKQRETLQRLVNDCDVMASPNGRVAKALNDAGLVKWAGEAGDGFYWLEITDAGRAALQQKGEAG